MLPFPIISSTPILEKLVITKIAAGQEHFLFLTSTGDVYGIGKNTYGQLGTGNTITQTDYVKVFSGARDIFCGERISFVIRDSDSAIMATGAVNSTGFSGNISTWQARTNLNVVASKGVKKICASQKICAILCNDNTLYTVGSGYLGNGVYTSGLQASLQNVANNAYDVSVSTESMYYRDNNQNIYGVGEYWALNLPLTANNQATWASQYGGVYGDMFNPELKTHYRSCLIPGSDRTYAVGLSSFGQLGNNNIADAQGNRVYPITFYLVGKPLFFGSSRGAAYMTMIATADGIYYSGRNTNGNVGFPGAGSAFGTYRQISLSNVIGPSTFDASLIQSLESNEYCTYLLYNNRVFITGLAFDGTSSTSLVPVNIKG
ncbi:putative DNA condensation protein [Erwinia phage pEa_SNUABM_47]|uniref:Putative DNA condensation protein n=1 Tax=Erwinia phage pEa_SNUABM_47 TaxID=2768774 RepID=A0A7L8ZNF1_9CAUD|nr:putative DNA condensation protein [Erwinia phage pEa_SNUABM_47]QXO11689.1 hypothetical protein pEaSNUABM19_00578 [Erwinia phage pEa_SNUABM_19]